MSTAMRRSLPGTLGRGPASFPVTPSFIYDSEDPYAVRIRFEDDVEWWLDRESLRTAMTGGYAGDGTLLVYSDYHQVEIVQCPIEGPGVFATFSYPKLAGLLNDSYRIVKRGKEGKLIDWDAFLTYVEGAS